MLLHFSAIAGLKLLSFISILLRLFLSIQFKSASVYATSGLISNKSAPAASASFSATFFVTPLAEKYVTNDWTDYRSVASHAYNTFPYLRYAEILMSYVEAKNELGQCTQEILDNTINKIRERAYNGTGLVYPYVEMASQEKLRTIIRMERRMEFPFEGIRYRDLLRLRIAEKVFITSEYQLSRAWSGRTDWDGKDMSIVSDAFKVLLKNWDEGNYPIGGIPQIDEDGLPDVEYMVEKGYQTRFYQYRFYKDKNYLWPIPASDLLVNGNLTQNPGY